METETIQEQAKKWIDQLDELAASGKYDDVALVVAEGTCVMESESIFHWQKHKLHNLTAFMERGSEPVGFLGVTISDNQCSSTAWTVPPHKIPPR